MPTKILLVDDDRNLVRLVRAYLEREGLEVREANDGVAAWDLIEEWRPDLVLLDVMLPKRDGISLLTEIRHRGRVPVIMLTAKVEEDDRLAGLYAGADDYVTKPFSPRELVARVRAVLRRSHPDDEATLALGTIALESERREVLVEGEPVGLTPTEFDLLAVLMGRPGRVFSRAQLLDLVQGEDFAGYDRAVDAHVKNLRHKLGAAGRYIKTVYGVGYKIEASDEDL